MSEKEAKPQSVERDWDPRVMELGAALYRILGHEWGASLSVCRFLRLEEDMEQVDGASLEISTELQSKLDAFNARERGERAKLKRVEKLIAAFDAYEEQKINKVGMRKPDLYNLFVQRLIEDKSAFVGDIEMLEKTLP
jgi:hypothetical protein